METTLQQWWWCLQALPCSKQQWPAASREENYLRSNDHWVGKQVSTVMGTMGTASWGNGGGIHYPCHGRVLVVIYVAVKLTLDDCLVIKKLLHGRKLTYVGSTAFVVAYSMLYSTTVHVLLQSQDRQARCLAIASQKCQESTFCLTRIAERFCFPYNS